MQRAGVSSSRGARPRRAGRAVSLGMRAAEFTRPVLDRRVPERRAMLARVEQETAWRAAAPQG